jgi:hypothetical protein
MTTISITSENVVLLLTQARGKIRIADADGNHIRKPTSAKNDKSFAIEWMITNDEVGELAKHFLNKEDTKELISYLGSIDKFIRDTKYATREAIKTTEEKLDKFLDFDIYKYTENFYSFEKKIDSGIEIRITFKMGDYTLAPHLFVLLPFVHEALVIKNINGVVGEGEILNSKCRGEWEPDKEDVAEIVKALAHASAQHRDDLIELLKS